MREKSKKTDRRTLYTKSAIKDTFLELKRKRALDSITITELCKMAEISRGTFYLHYGNISEVLNELIDDALSDVMGTGEKLEGAESCEGEGGICPLCHYIRRSKKYRCLFSDDTLTSRIVNQIVSKREKDFLNGMPETGLTADEFRMLSFFQISGCYALARQNISLSENQWCPMRGVLDKFIKAGYATIKK